jgi:hypothetical protein
MTSSGNRDREAWTRFIEEREREKQPKRPRKKKQPESSREELEQVLDDLTKEPKP